VCYFYIFYIFFNCLRPCLLGSMHLLAKFIRFIYIRYFWYILLYVCRLDLHGRKLPMTRGKSGKLRDLSSSAGTKILISNKNYGLFI
jgi:hypothetical protein